MIVHLRRGFGALLASTCLLSATAVAGPFSALYVFGDSLSDTGNVTALVPGLPPPPYAPGRFSNGAVYADILAQNLGLAVAQPAPVGSGIAPSLTGGTNFAVGGARTAGHPDFGAPFGLLGQVAAYTGSPGSADPNALYVVWAGGNDLRDAGLLPPPAAAAAMVAAAGNVAGAVNTLYLDGARNVLVLNLPNIGRTPEAIAAGPLAVAGATALSGLFNAVLAGNLAALDVGSPGLDLDTLDVFALLEGAFANAAAFGFTDTTHACLATPAACLASPDAYIFWDSIHPTAALHRIVGDAAFVAVPAPATLLLLAIGLLGAGWSRRVTAR